MEDYSGLKAAIPASPTSGRLWGVPKKRRAEDRNPEGRQQREGRDREDKEIGEEEHEPEERADAEEFRYGAHGMRKKKNHQVDVII